MQSWLRTIAVLAVSVCACYALWRASRALDTAHMALWNVSAAAYAAKPTIDRANATLDAVNAPCVGFHGSVTCGPLAQLSQTEKNVGILAGQAALQVKQSAALVDSASAAVTSATADVHRMATAGTGALTAATETLGAGKHTIESLQPLIGHSDEVIRHFDALVSSPDLTAALSNIQFTTQNVAGVTLDLRKVSDKAAADYLSPKPWYRKVGRFAGDAFDYGALFARHVP